MKKILILTVGILCSYFGYSQESTKSLPIYYDNGIDFSVLEEITNIVELPYINNEEEELRASAVCADCEDHYYGTGVNIAINLKTQGHYQVAEDGTEVWVIKVESSTALGMQFYFDKFKLPEGAELHIYNEDRTRKIGAFTHLNNQADESRIIKFGTEIVIGSNIYIEYSEPTDVAFQGEVSISKIVHVFNFYTGTYATNGGALPCNINVNCSEGDLWEKEKRAVALILGYDESQELAAWCTGALLNNTEEDARPLFLTANHCLPATSGSQSTFDVSTLVFLFNYEAHCLTNQQLNAGNSIYGSTLLSAENVNNPTSDYLLLQLHTATPETLGSINACLAGWSLSSPIAGATGIHHPSGDVKQICFASGIPISSAYPPLNNTNQYHWEVTLDAGTVQKGSSGSPLFNQNHRVIGQLHGPDGLRDDCIENEPGTDPVWYGKFNTSWNQGNFSTYLAPNNSTLTYTDTYCPSPSIQASFQGYVGCKSIDFQVNGNDENIIDVCLTEDIILAAEPKVVAPGWYCSPRTQGYFPLTYENFYTNKFGTNCNDLKQQYPYFSYVENWTNCFIRTKKLHVSITEHGHDLAVIGPEYHQWKYFGPETYFGDPNNTPYNNVSLGIITIEKTLANFRLQDYLPTGATLLPGKVYRVKISSLDGNGGWITSAKYIRTYATNVSLSGTVSYNLVGDNITLQNATVSNHIDVVASNSITIKPNSDLMAGHYVINHALQCDFFSGFVANNNHNDQYGDNFSEYIENDITSDIDLEEPKDIEHIISVLPNPFITKTIVKCDFNLESCASAMLSILDNNGTIIQEYDLKKLGTTSAIVNLKDHRHGVYYARLTVDHIVLDVNKLVLSD
ncbi:MAG: hypothetical protein COA58_10400 [Bacteroidetes bacterium]|nr:MAG: hypothetical protein COA58_10400 [Bacteroidota bacterium]